MEGKPVSAWPPRSTKTRKPPRKALRFGSVRHSSVLARVGPCRSFQAFPGLGVFPVPCALTRPAVPSTGLPGAS